MATIRFDLLGEFDLDWPDEDHTVLSQADKLVAFEAALPADQRCPFLPVDFIRTLADQVRAALAATTDGEVLRSTSASQLASTLLEAIPHGKIAVESLKGLYPRALGSLEAWGLKCTVAKNGAYTVRKPRTNLEWITMLPVYVAREQSLPEESRVKDPPLDKMAELASRLTQGYESRASGKSQREKGHGTLGTTAGALRLALQASALMLVATRFQGHVTRDLQDWGFTVVARRSAASNNNASKTPEGSGSTDAAPASSGDGPTG